MQLSFIPILSVALTSLLQPTLQVQLHWKYRETRTFHRVARSYIDKAITPYNYNSSSTTIAVKCAGRRNAPYGITIKELEMTPCKCFGSWCPPRCRLTLSPTVECQYAARLDRFSSDEENFLGLFCYDKIVGILDKNTSMEDICDKWRYPGTDFPQLQIPDHLKSLHSYVLRYMPPQLEKREVNSSSSDKNWPKNEHERTGFGGRGHLEKLGPNYVLYLVVTSQSGDQFKIVTEESTEALVLPQFVSEDKNIGEPFIKKSAKKMRDEMGDCSDPELDEIIRNKTVLHGGYLKDRLNTDNAWMQGFIVHLHDLDGRCFGSLSRGWRPEQGLYRWVHLGNDTVRMDNLLSPIVSPFVANYK